MAHPMLVFDEVAAIRSTVTGDLLLEFGCNESTSMTSNSACFASALGVGSLTTLFGLLEPAVAGYALRLYHILGRKVGWWVFATFSLLALGHFFHSSGAIANVFGSAVSFDLVTLLIPFLLLIGMVHAESTIVVQAREGRKEDVRIQNESNAQQQIGQLTHEMEGLRGKVACLSEREKALQSSAQLYYQMFMSNPQAMWVFDVLSLQILAVNEAAQAQYGLTVKEFMSKTDLELVPAQQAEAFVADISRPAPDSRLGTLWPQRRKDGSVFEAQLKAIDLQYSERTARLIVASDCTRTG